MPNRYDVISFFFLNDDHVHLTDCCCYFLDIPLETNRDRATIYINRKNIYVRRKTYSTEAMIEVNLTVIVVMVMMVLLLVEFV
jgi:hypothetical protein